MSIQARFSVSAARFGEGLIWATTYSGMRPALLAAGILVNDQFPTATKAKSSANGSHPEAGRWYLWQEDPLHDIWSITYYSAGFVAELGQDALHRLQRHLLHDLQITPETIGAILMEWRKHATRQHP